MFEDDNVKEENNNIKNNLNVPKDEKKSEEITNSLDDFLDLNMQNDDNAPMLPQDDEEDTYDLQKELEAKFDELFGPLEDD